MALAEETSRIAALFEYSDEEVNKGVLEFLRQMSTIMPQSQSRYLDFLLTYV